MRGGYGGRDGGREKGRYGGERKDKQIILTCSCLLHQHKNILTCCYVFILTSGNSLYRPIHMPRRHHQVIIQAYTHASTTPSGHYSGLYTCLDDTIRSLYRPIHMPRRHHQVIIQAYTHASTTPSGHYTGLYTCLDDTIRSFDDTIWWP